MTDDFKLTDKLSPLTILSQMGWIRTNSKRALEARYELLKIKKKGSWKYGI